MPVYNLIEYSYNCSKTSGSLCQYYRDEPPLTVANAIEDFTGVNSNDKSFKFKQKITCQTDNNNRKKC